jgi:hypothetical protein
MQPPARSFVPSRLCHFGVSNRAATTLAMPDDRGAGAADYPAACLLRRYEALSDYRSGVGCTNGSAAPAGGGLND